MANRNTQGYGLIPVATLGNTPSTQGQSAYKIEAAYGTSIYNGAPVVSAAGYMTEGTVVTTGTTGMLGVLNGIFYNASTTLKPTWANFYLATITPANSEVLAPWRSFPHPLADCKARPQEIFPQGSGIPEEVAVLQPMDPLFDLVELATDP